MGTQHLAKVSVHEGAQHKTGLLMLFLASVSRPACCSPGAIRSQLSGDAARYPDGLGGPRTGKRGE